MRTRTRTMVVVAGGAAGLGALAWMFWPKGQSDLDQVEDESGGNGPLGLDWLPILRAIGQLESGRDWGRVGLEAEGVSWGYWQQNQAAGVLGRTLERWRQLDPAGFSAWSGPGGSNLLATLNSASRATRLSVDLSQPARVASLRLAGQQELAHRAQLLTMLDDFREPLLPGLERARMTTLLEAGVVLDRANQQGPAAAQGFLARTAGATPEARIGSFVSAALAALDASSAALVARRIDQLLELLESASGEAVA